MVSGEERIVLGGGYQQGNNTDFGIMRLRANGAKDTTFGSSGSVQTDFNGGGDQISGVSVDSSNRLVVAGSAGPGKGMKTGTDFGVARYTTSGQLDSTFGTGGKQRTDFAGGSDTARSVTIQTDGKIVACSSVHNGSNGDLGLTRYTSTGALDVTFGYGGRVQLDLFGRSDGAHSVVTQTVTNPDGTTRERLLAGGNSDTGAGYDTLVAAFEE